MATRSPSPIPSRPRTPESSHDLRKSKEIPQRSSLSKPSAPNSPSIRASFEQKENVKSRAPVISSSKGSKNFMAPTISAASKAVPPSPRKKVLQERNEVINSVSNSLEFHVKEVSSAVEIGEFGVKSELGFGSQEVLDSGELKQRESRIKNWQNGIVPSVSPLPVVSPLDPDPSIPPYDPKTNYLSPRPQFLHYRPNPRIEHYINREGEVLDEGDGRRLEDSFSSESGEDDVTGLTEEKDLLESSEDDVTVLIKEKDSECGEDDVKDLEEEPSPAEVEDVESPSETLVSEPKFKFNREGEVLNVGGGRRLEDSFSSDSGEDDVTGLTGEKDLLESSEDDMAVLIKEKDSECGEDDVKDLEEEPLPAEDVESLSETLVSEPKFKFKPLMSRYFRRSKFVPFLLVLVMACLYAPLTDSPIMSLPKFYTPSYQDFEDLQFGDYFAVANENLHVLASRFRHWSTDSIAYFTSVTSSPKDCVGLYPLVNMTISSAVDDSVGSELSYRLETETEQAVKEDEVAEESFIGHESEVSAAVKDEDVKCNAETMEMGIMGENTEMEVTENEAEKIEMVVSEVAGEGEIGAQRIEMGVSEDVVDAYIVVYEMEEEITEDDGRNELEQVATHPSYEATDIKEEVENAEIAHVVVEPEIIGDEEGCGDVNSIEDIQSANSVDNQSDFAEEYQTSDGLELLKSINYTTVLGLSSALLVLAATLAFLSMKPRQIPAVQKGRETIKKIGSVSGSSETYIHAKRSPSQNPQGNEGMIGDSGLSEASCSWNNTSYSGRQTKRETEEQNLSHERRMRRDSVSSSISYGSFTTYERLSAKKGGRDEEVVTPVRRSSRIRNLV